MSFKSDRQPLGVVIFQMALNKWYCDLPPEDGLEFKDTLKKTKRNVKMEGLRLFQKLVKEYLLDNNHMVHLAMYPSDTLEAEMLVVSWFIGLCIFVCAMGSLCRVVGYYPMYSIHIYIIIRSSSSTTPSKPSKGHGEAYPPRV